MHTYLPTIQKKELRKEYLVRLTVVTCMMLLAVCVLAIIFLLPSYFITYAQRAQSLTGLELVQSRSVTTETKEIEAQVKVLREITSRFVEGADRVSTVQALSLAYSSLVPGVRLTEMEYTYTASSTVDMRIAGIAQTRDALINFKKKVETNPAIKKVELPVSDLAKSKQIVFTMKIQSK